MVTHAGVLAFMCAGEQKPDKVLTITTDSSWASDRQHDSSSYKVLAITTDSSRASDRQHDSSSSKHLIVNISVLSSASDNTSILLAPIMTNFPNYHLQLGTKLNCPKYPVLRCVIDTTAALTTCNFHFVAAVAKRYPHCVAKIFVPKDYNPIVLSGIVQGGGESVTTELSVGF